MDLVYVLKLKACACKTAFRSRHFLLLLTLLFFHKGSYAQDLAGNIAVKTYPVSTIGLDGSPLHLLADKKGRIWIGSKNGLACFDGVRFNIFTEEDGLAGNFITDIKMDRNGTVYASSMQGISRFTGGIRPFEKLPNLEDVGFITCLLPVNADTVYFGSIRYGGVHSWIRGKADEPYPNIGSTLVVTDLLFGKNGELYAAQADSVQIYYKGRTTGVAISTGIKRWSMLTMAEDGEVWCAAGKAYSLKRTGITDSMQLPTINPAFLDKLLPLNNHVLLAGNSNLWQYGNNRWAPLLKANTFPQQITDIIAVGKELWTCGAFGLMRISFPPGISGVDASRAYLFTDRNGRGFAGINEQPDMKDEQIRKQLAPVLREVFRSRDGRNWYLTGKGVYWWEDARLRYYVPPPADASSGLSFYSAFEDPEGRVWFGTGHGMIYYYDKSFVIPPYVERISKRDLSIISIAHGGKNRVVAGSNEQIFVLKDKEAFPDEYNLGFTNALNSHGIISNSKGALWTNIRTMMCRITASDSGKLLLSDTLRLSDFGGRSVEPEAMAFDREDNLWVLTNKFLFVFLHNNHKPAYLSDRKFMFSANDFPGLFTEQGSKQLYADTAGRLMVISSTTAYTLSAVDIIANAEKQRPPLLSLVSVLQNGRPADWKTNGYRVTDGIPENPMFSDSIQTIRFDYTATTALNAEYITYHYRLAGYEKAWNNNDHATTITYNRLPPGKYTLEIRARDNNGRWSNVITYPFRVLPPWWRTWWAYMAYIIVALLSGAAIFYYRLRSLRRKDALQQLISEQKMKALRAQINPHFLQNTFDFMAQSLINEQPDQTLGVITQVSSFMRNVLYRSDEAVVNMEQELDFAAEYLAINRLLFHNNFNYAINISQEADITDITVPSMLLQPLLENAIAHGVRHTETNGLITVSVAVSGDYLVSSITNNNDGRRYRNMTNGYQPKGMKFTEERLAVLYRKSKVKPKLSCAASDTSFTVDVFIPIRSD